MTAAAHAFEYEVPDHGTPPVEAVEAAERGNVVYLTRDGRRFAAVESVEERLRRLTARADELERREALVADHCRQMWAAARDWDPAQKQVLKLFLDRFMDTAEDEADHAFVDAAQADPEPPIPAAQLWAELGIDDRT